LHAIQKAK
jgi:hypothetical protein